MHTILVVVHLFLSIGLIGLILIQHGKGADAGAAFGSGASSTVFGARGSANFLSRTTGVLALLFFITSLTLAWMAMQTARDSGLIIDAPSVETQPIPAAESDLPVVPGATGDSDVPVVPATPAETAVPAPVAPDAAKTESEQK
ncbi:preprotein translocase subunit SecG [Thiolapillus sp.]|uniref:preprotein translocase subunit SecG n=1 Tax=Thiolapillus sp. TaxID=2017437 RepID=UPI003AF87D32